MSLHRRSEDVPALAARARRPGHEGGRGHICGQPHADGPGYHWGSQLPALQGVHPQGHRLQELPRLCQQNCQNRRLRHDKEGLWWWLIHIHSARWLQLRETGLCINLDCYSCIWLPQEMLYIYASSAYVGNMWKKCCWIILTLCPMGSFPTSKFWWQQ